MKLIQKILLLSFALANGFAAVAQTNSVSLDADPDYSKFSQFISDRNIFDPSRYPHEVRIHRPRPRQSRSNSAPTFTLVGTMSYEKGMFAFFSGNSDDVKKILTLNGEIAGYAVTEIAPAGAKLLGADKKEIVLRIGDQMRRENNGWQLVEQGDSPAGSGLPEAPAATTGDGSGSATSDAAGDSPAPSASLDSNDVLKRLKEKREQENK